MDVTINNVSYTGVPRIDVPKTAGGTASFHDTSEDTATASDIAKGKTAHGASGLITGTATDSLNTLFNGVPDENGDPSYDEFNFTMSDNNSEHKCFGFQNGYNVTLPETIRRVERAAFMGQEKLHSFYASGVTSAGDFALSRCTELMGLSLPLLATGGDYMFMNCQNLGTNSGLRFPSLQQIGGSMFQGCWALEDLYLGFDGVVSFSDLSYNPFSTGSTRITVHVPAGQLSAYNSNSDWATVKDMCANESIPLTIVGDYA